MQTRPFPAALETAQDTIARAVAEAFANRDDPLNVAMAYALEGGKALRGFYVLESARLHGIEPDMAVPAAMAIECMHAYSLIHDDLPCMDDDDLRRGKPTVHKAWDEYTAVLAGDALQTLTFELLAGMIIEPAAVVDLVQSMALASGRDGMVGGQMLDIQAESATEPATLDQILAVQKGKTGALIKWSTAAGALMSGSNPVALETYGARVGLAFQIADDILDVEGDEATVGKAVGKDADAGKATFISLLGLEGAKKRASELIEEACDALEPYADASETLREAARFVVSRKS